MPIVVSILLRSPEPTILSRANVSMLRTLLARDGFRLWLARAALAGLVAYFVTVGFLGIDYGYHWDEWYNPQGLKHCVDTLTWFPQRQIYNGIVVGTLKLR